MDLKVEGQPVFAHTGGVHWDPDRGDHVVVLVHGAGNDHSVWRYQTRLLAAVGIPVLAVDLPGHGRSGGEALTTVEGLAAWVLSLLDALDTTHTTAPSSSPRSATLVGHSMGSLIALATAHAAPDRIRGIGLVGTSPQMGVHPALQAAADARDPAAIDLIVGWSHTAASRFGGHRQAGVWTRAQTRRLLERNLPALGTDLSACAGFDGRAVATALDVDALVISGQHDRMTPARDGATIAELLDAPHVVVPDGSHVSLYDHPDAVNAALLPWLASARTDGHLTR